MNSESTNGLDPEGYIQTYGAIENIPAAFQPVVEAAVAHLTSTLEAKLHSIYLYGSVATGEARAGQSDLDIIAIFRDTVSDQDQTEIKLVADALSNSHRSLVREVSIGATSRQEALASESLPGIGCFLKHLCVCLAGEDIRPLLPKFRPSAVVARGFNGDYAAEMRSMLEELARANQPEVAQAVMRRICRKTIRTSFSLVMPRLGRWTTDLGASCDYFSRFYPEKQASISLMLEWSEHSPAEKEQCLRIVTPFANWLTAEFDRVIGH